MSSLLKLANKFSNYLNIQAQTSRNKTENFGGWYDPVGYARLALQLENKYDPNHTAEGQLPDGRKVRLLSSQQAKEIGSFHRVQILCQYCDKWVPAGRMGQHEPACLKRNLPLMYDKKVNFKNTVKQIMEEIHKEKSFQNKIEKSMVLIDMLQESGDPRWMAATSNLNQDIIRYKAHQILEKENIYPSSLYLKSKTDNVSIFRFSSNNVVYILYLNTKNGDYHIKEDKSFDYHPSTYDD